MCMMHQAAPVALDALVPAQKENDITPIKIQCQMLPLTHVDRASIRNKHSTLC
jgi:hypothetical protein